MTSPPPTVGPPPSTASGSQIVPSPTSLTTRPVDLRQIDKIVVYEVMETELNSLEQALQEANQSLGFFTAFAGALVGAVLAYMATSLDAITAFKFHVAMALLAVGTLWFFVSWRRKSSSSQGLLKKIRIPRP